MLIEFPVVAILLLRQVQKLVFVIILLLILTILLFPTSFWLLNFHLHLVKNQIKLRIHLLRIQQFINFSITSRTSILYMYYIKKSGAEQENKERETIANRVDRCRRCTDKRASTERHSKRRTIAIHNPNKRVNKRIQFCETATK